MEEQTSKNQNQNPVQPQQTEVGTPAIGQETQVGDPPIVDPVNELDTLKQELDQYKLREQQVQQQGMSEDQKEIDNLKKELHDLAKQEVLASGYFKEAEVKDYTHEQLKAMGDVIRKITKQGQPSRGAATPKPKEKDKPLGIWKDTSKNDGKGEWVS